MSPTLCATLVLAVGAMSWGGRVSAKPASPSRAARSLIDVTPAAARGRLLAPFSDDARSDWHYTPRRRAGIAFRD